MVWGVPEGFGAFGNRGECSSGQLCCNRDCRTQHERVPDIGVPKHKTKYKTSTSITKNMKKNKHGIMNKTAGERWARQRMGGSKCS